MKIKHGPLKCWDIYAEHLSNQSQLFNSRRDFEMLKKFQDQLGWSTELPAKIQSNAFDALVLTDCNKQIIWANKGFSKMTGYPLNYALGRTPNFLQGKATSKATLNQINTKLKKGMPFKAVVSNYKKNGHIYKCELNIYPIKSSNNEITHYLALEKQLQHI